MLSTLPPASQTAIPFRPFWSPKQLAELLGVSRRTIWTWVAAGKLPQPRRISHNVVRWDHSAVSAFIQHTLPPFIAASNDQPVATEVRP